MDIFPAQVLRGNYRTHDRRREGHPRSAVQSAFGRGQHDRSMRQENVRVPCKPTRWRFRIPDAPAAKRALQARGMATAIQFVRLVHSPAPDWFAEKRECLNQATQLFHVAFAETMADRTFH